LIKTHRPAAAIEFRIRKQRLLINDNAIAAKMTQITVDADFVCKNICANELGLKATTVGERRVM